MNNIEIHSQEIPKKFISEKALTEIELQEYAKNTCEKLLEDKDAKEIYIIAYELEMFAKFLKDTIKEKTLSSLDIKGENVLGAVLKIRNKAKEYEYSDNELNAISAEIETLKAKKKEREHFLQSLKKNIVVETTGEIITPAKLVSAGITVVVELPKKK